MSLPRVPGKDLEGVFSEKVEEVFVLVESLDGDVVDDQVSLFFVGYVDGLLTWGAHLSLSIVNHQVRKLDFVLSVVRYFLLKGSEEVFPSGVENGCGVIGSFCQMFQKLGSFVN